MITRFWLVALLFLMLPIGAAAQGTITKYDQQVFAPGVSPVTGSPQWTNTYLATDVVCGQAPITAPPTAVNPTRFAFDDQKSVGKICIITFASSLLAALPNGVGYVFTLTQTDDLGQTSPRSAASNPFNKQGVPAILTGLRVIP